MKVLIIGATGNCGQRLVKAGLEKGHEVTAFARNREKLTNQIGGQPGGRVEAAQGGGLYTVIGDVTDHKAVAAAMAGQDVIVNAAGNARDGEVFVDIVALVIDQTRKVLGKGGRLWLFGGVAALNVPGTSIMGVDLPKVPAMFRRHKVNYERVAATDLDWSMICPGPLVPAANGMTRSDLRLSSDQWPVPLPLMAHFLPRVGLSLTLMRLMPEMIVSYEDVAAFIMDNLEQGGRYSRRRVGLALPRGERGRKHDQFGDNATTTG